VIIREEWAMAKTALITGITEVDARLGDPAKAQQKLG
jgi:hypothetical protein